MDTKHREVFTNLLIGLQLLFFEAYGTDTEYSVGHTLFFDLQDLAEEFGSKKYEYMALLHNAGLIVQGKPPLDIDEFIENCKLCDILHDVNI